MLLTDPPVDPPVDHADASPRRAGPAPAAPGTPGLPAPVRVRLAQDTMRAGLVREARTGFEALLATLPDDVTALPVHRAAARAGLVEALLAQGELDRAAAVLPAAVLPAGSTAVPGSPHDRARGFELHAAGELAAARGDTAAAVDLFHAAGAVLEAGPDQPDQPDQPEQPDQPAWRIGAALALARLGRVGEAAALAEQHRARAHDAGRVHDVALALRVLCVLDTTGARGRLLHECRATLVGVTARRLAAQVDADLAGLLLLQAAATDEAGVGTPTPTQDEAARLLGGVERYALTEGLWPLLGRARALLAATGATGSSGSSGSSGPSGSVSALARLEGLTASERRVVERAAGGATNREIAASLEVSVKAVEWHLSRAYRRLGVSSRRALVEALSAPVRTA